MSCIFASIRATDGRRHLLRALVPEANVPSAVANADHDLEAVALTGRRLLLHRHDLHHVVLELAGAEDRVDDLVLLDRQRVQVDVLDRGDAALLHEAAELRARHPLLLLTLALALALLPLALTLAVLAEGRR